MKYISSQHYLNESIVAEKETQLIQTAASVVSIPCIYVGEIDGEEYAMVFDHHHLMAAAKALGINVTFAVDDDPEGLTGDTLLETRWIDGDYYDVEASDPMNDEFYLVW